MNQKKSVALPKLINESLYNEGFKYWGSED